VIWIVGFCFVCHCVQARTSPSLLLRIKTLTAFAVAVDVLPAATVSNGLLSFGNVLIPPPPTHLLCHLPIEGVPKPLTATPSGGRPGSDSPPAGSKLMDLPWASRPRASHRPHGPSPGSTHEALHRKPSADKWDQRKTPARYNVTQYGWHLLQQDPKQRPNHPPEVHRCGDGSCTSSTSPQQPGRLPPGRRVNTIRRAASFFLAGGLSSVRRSRSASYIAVLDRIRFDG